jgi:hypothetical protein
MFDKHIGEEEGESSGSMGVSGRGQPDWVRAVTSLSRSRAISSSPVLVPRPVRRKLRKKRSSGIDPA